MGLVGVVELKVQNLNQRFFRAHPEPVCLLILEGRFLIALYPVNKAELK
tara:strand:- start:249 stop:395 length:147 start_codon:yes stop_codon:yes gene_type:complete